MDQNQWLWGQKVSYQYRWVKQLSTIAAAVNNCFECCFCSKRYWLRLILFVLCRFAGVRYAPPLDTPNMMLLYDTNGKVAGMQSVVPQAELEFQCDGIVNEYYVKDVINHKTVSIPFIIYIHLCLWITKANSYLALCHMTRTTITTPRTTFILRGVTWQHWLPSHTLKSFIFKEILLVLKVQ